MTERVRTGKQLILIMLVVTYQSTTLMCQDPYDAGITRKEILTSEPTMTPVLSDPFLLISYGMLKN